MERTGSLGKSLIAYGNSRRCLAGLSASGFAGVAFHNPPKASLGRLADQNGTLTSVLARTVRLPLNDATYLPPKAWKRTESAHLFRSHVVDLWCGCFAWNFWRPNKVRGKMPHHRRRPHLS